MASQQDRPNPDSNLETVLMNLRSVTQSRKGGVPLSCLERDYKDLLGKPIPYLELGYPTLQAFLRKIPDVISLRNKDGLLVAEGVADSSTAHIVSLVNRQKATKLMAKPSRRPHVIHRRGGLSSRYSSRHNSSKPFPPRNYAQFSYQDNKHSNPAPSVSRPKSPVRSNSPKPQSPVVPRASYIPPRKHEIPPRFLRLQQQKREPEPVKIVARSESPSQRNSRLMSPEPPQHTFISEPYNNIIRSPRPLQTTRNTTVKKDRYKELESAATSKEYIEIYASMHNLPYNYITKPLGQKKKYKSFISSLCLGEKKYQSYPEHASTEEDAEEIAAKVAVDAVKASREHLATYPETSIRNAEDVQILLDRIEEIVCEKPSGMFTNGITNEYEIKYNESIPENWLKLLQQSSIVEIEELDVPYGRVPEGVHYIVRPSKLSSGSTTPSSTSELEKTDYLHEDSVPRTIVRKDHLPAIPKLMVPIGNEWAVYIVDVSKTIAARIVDYNNVFLNMSEKMKDFYKSEYLPAVEISEGLLYATSDPDSDIFHRVLVQKLKDNDLVECYFVDEGMICDVMKSYLQELHSDFWLIPYQAIHLTLDSLDDYEVFITQGDLKRLLGLTLVALVKRCCTPIVDFFPDDPAVHKILYSVVLFDTDGSEDLNMNDIIKESVLESLASKLPKLSTTSRGYLTHVQSTGEIFLRVHSPHESFLEVELEKLSLIFEDACLQTVDVPHDKICAAKYEDGKWYRAVVLENSNSLKDPQKVEMFFIDVGFTSIIPVNNVCDLETCSEFLSSLGAQAIKCELFNPLPSPNAEWTPAAISKLKEFAPENEELIVRVISEGDDLTLPKVNLHKRTYQNGDSFIISINESLAMEPGLFKTATNHATNNSSQAPSLKLNFQSRIRTPLSKTTALSFNNGSPIEESLPVSIMPPSPAIDSLKWATTPDNIKSPDAIVDSKFPPLQLPEVPVKGERFDVFVTMAAHPHNFYVQPYKTVAEMNHLMGQMYDFYSIEDNLIEMHLSLLEENGFYAVKHTDNMWYRARLQSISKCDPVMIAMMYVDFGDIVNVNMNQLQSLWSNFRLLPCQAITASLSGVKPIHGDWQALQCVEFQEIVKEKRFVSIVQNKHLNQKDSFCVLEVELTLIDVTDPKEDVYIHELLIEKGMACPA